MGFFTCILILIVLYCPWLIPVLFVVFILFMIYHYSPVLFGILVGGIVIFCITAIVYTEMLGRKPKKKHSRKR